MREPQPAIYKPVGVPLRDVDHVVLSPEELESLRLADLEGHYQEQAAAQMGVSRSTFQRTVIEARRKVAQALVEGMALQIEGVTVRVRPVRWHCDDCHHHWDVTHGSGQGEPRVCPVCASDAIRQRRRHRRH